jgi:hypothetical protein
MAVGLPAAGGVAVISAALTLFPQPISVLLIILGAIPLAISAIGYRFLRRAMVDSSRDIRER